MSRLESLDQTFALRVTLRYFWKPLYGDYSVVGHIFGFFFRSARVLIALVVYLIIAILAFAFYLIWLALPFAILFLAYRAYLTKAT